MGSSAAGDLAKLSMLGHFLKGSSATIGLIKVKDGCEKIQNFGDMKDATGIHHEADKEVCLQRIKDTLVVLKKDFAEVKKQLTEYYDSGN